MAFYCPHCDAGLEADSGYLGRSVVCPSCHKDFTLYDTHTQKPRKDITVKYSEPRQYWLKFLIVSRKCFFPIWEMVSIPRLWLCEVFGGASRTAEGRRAAKERTKASRLEKDQELVLMHAEQKRFNKAVIQKHRDDRQLIQDEINKGVRMPQSGFVCSSCGHIINPTAHTKGSCLIEGILWLFFLIPGLIYSIWRITSREDVCPACKGKPIPINSPQGQELWTRFHKKG